MGENGENEEEEDIEENNEGTAPDEGAQVIVDLRNNRGSAYNGAVSSLLLVNFIDCIKLQDTWRWIEDGIWQARNIYVKLENYWEPLNRQKVTPSVSQDQ